MGLACWIECFTSLLLVFALYKILDALIRLPFLGGRRDRYIFITGCDTGFGHDLATRLDASGCHVIAGCLTKTGQRALQTQSSARLLALLLDVTDRNSVRRAWDSVVAHLPPGKGLWGVVNNAGIGVGVGLVDWRQDMSDYQRALDVNLLGLVDVTATFLPFVKRTQGRIVNMASVLGRLAVHCSAPYAISKHGVEAFSDVLRREMRPFGCTVHIVEPGYHNTSILSKPHTGVGTAWDRASAEIKTEYGPDYCRLLSEHSAKTVRAFVSDCVSDVVDAYEHALLGVYPRARYVVGKDARFFFIPVTWLPEWLGDWVLELVTGRGRPIPAILQHKRKTS